MLSSELQATFQRALEDVRARRHEYLTLEHLLLAMLDDPSGADIVGKCGGDVEQLRGDLERFLDEQVEQLRARANGYVIELIDRAKAAGRLRADFVGEDLLLLLVANAAIVQVTSADAPDAWRRFVALALDAFQLPGERRRLPAPPSTAQVTRAMIRLARARGCGKRS